ncbi:SCO family protein [Flavobacterium gawalongense]|uniref:SCO family protein n=1 Tax=Flavobacterium gawalongense TaxID=2594432 RepID=A0A553BXB8_9FLAO|nr:SCO family protein [Flavobacterium gawalongense]TRX04232.1 SCO family protein [Flavobacterium gawalongense]TRX09318.1 SCO family protein [Flavobacterium gawalongense]TRX12868.1 SCO family protein [Flavobacterium gawalongense]TRX13213.1 SCO family protein [Flavobacterium gawalongense]TRX30725.1 SCO family protein [Flavobacterium gawalongense]
MLKNKSYIGISFIVLIFGIYAVPKIIDKIQNNEVVRGDRLDKVNPTTKGDEKLVKIGPAPKFELVNQDNKKITNETYKGKVYVLEFFFSTCPTICPKMNASMLAIEKSFFGNPNFGIVSITIDPLNDTPEVLKKHAALLGVKSSNWNFLTGDKAYVFDLANKGFNLYAGENAKVTGGFEHSGLFALIDKNGNIRCRKDDFGNPILYYDGLDKKGVRNIQQDINILLEE